MPLITVTCVKTGEQRDFKEIISQKSHNYKDLVDKYSNNEFLEPLIQSVTK